MMALGVFFMGLAVTIYNKTLFGTDPYTCMNMGITKQTGIPFGITNLSMNIVVILLAFRFGRHLIGIGTLINMTCVGFIADFMTWVYELIFPDPEALWVKIIMFGIIVVLHSFGGSIFFTAALGIGAYDVVGFVLAEKTKISYRWCRVTTDVVCTGIGFSLGSTVGAGTVVTAFFMGPLIQWFTDHFSLRFLYGKEEATRRIAAEKEERKKAREKRRAKRNHG